MESDEAVQLGFDFEQKYDPIKVVFEIQDGDKVKHTEILITYLDDFKL